MYTLISDTVEEFGPILRICVKYDYGGWIHAYADASMGTLLIASDWGDWTYRWGLAGIPKCGFVNFLFDRKQESWVWHYVADKLMYGREATILDVEKTQSHLRRRLAEAYRRNDWKDWSSSTRGDMYSDAIDDVNRMTRFEDVYGSESIHLFYSVDPDDMMMMPSPEIVQLRDFILPALGAAYARYRTSEAA